MRKLFWICWQKYKRNDWTLYHLPMHEEGHGKTKCGKKIVNKTYMLVLNENVKGFHALCSVCLKAPRHPHEFIEV